jgi:hypothetical protein
MDMFTFAEISNKSLTTETKMPSDAKISYVVNINIKISERDRLFSYKLDICNSRDIRSQLFFKAELEQRSGRTTISPARIREEIHTLESQLDTILDKNRVITKFNMQVQTDSEDLIKSNYENLSFDNFKKIFDLEEDKLLKYTDTLPNMVGLSMSCCNIL